MHLCARNERRRNQQREGGDQQARAARKAEAACRCRGQRACGACADAPHGACGRGLVSYSSAVINTEVSDSMGSDRAACSHLHEGQEGGRSARLGSKARMGRKGGGDRPSRPSYVIGKAPPQGVSTPDCRVGHVRWLWCKALLGAQCGASMIWGRSRTGDTLASGTQRTRAGWRCMRRRTMRPRSRF